MTGASTVAAAVALATALAAGGCGRPGVLDVDRAEDRIAEELADTYEVPVEDVSCPDGVRVEEGASFSCRAAVGDGQTVEVSVVQVDGEGALEVTTRQAVLSTSDVEDDAAATLADRFSRQSVEVTCGGPAVRVEEPDATFTCEAVDGGESRTVEVRVRDATGALTYSLD